jgi:hypothetical protein
LGAQIGIARTLIQNPSGKGLPPSSAVFVSSIVTPFATAINLNISTEGIVDWIAQNVTSGNSQSLFESSTPWTWKLNGSSRGRFLSLALDSNENGGSPVNTQVASSLQLTANAGDERFKFAASPNRIVAFVAPGLTGAAIGCGHSVIYPGDGLTHDFKIYVWASKALQTVTLTCHMLDNSSGDVSAIQQNTSAIDASVLTFRFRAKVAFGNQIEFRALVTNNGGSTFCGAGIQAITVF